MQPIQIQIGDLIAKSPDKRNRLQENRKVIADQLDTMADALQDWDQGIRCMDRTERVLLAKIAFETRERGLDVKQIHVYEDKEKRRMVTALVASKWGGGIPVKNYRKALERASGMAVRLKRGYQIHTDTGTGYDYSV